jgi:hypothetical protein
VFNEILRFAQDDSQNAAVSSFAGVEKAWVLDGNSNRIEDRYRNNLGDLSDESQQVHAGA